MPYVPKSKEYQKINMRINQIENIVLDLALAGHSIQIYEIGTLPMKKYRLYIKLFNKKNLNKREEKQLLQLERQIIKATSDYTINGLLGRYGLYTLKAEYEELRNKRRVLYETNISFTTSMILDTGVYRNYTPRLYVSSRDDDLPWL